MSYAQDAIDALNAELTEEGEDLSQEDSILSLLYATLVLVKGEQTTLKDVHDAWSVWASRYEPWRQSLVPFDQLPEWVQAYDRSYLDSIQIAASKVNHA